MREDATACRRLAARIVFDDEALAVTLVAVGMQVAALRFASDVELALLVERATREQLKPADIKRAVQTWRPDLDRT